MKDKPTYKELEARIHALERAEDAARESEARFRNLLDQVDIIPVQGYDAQRRVVYWNTASEKVYGYAKDEAIGRRLEDLIIPAGMRQGVIDDIRRWINGGSPIPGGELVLCDKKGDPVHVYSSHVMHQTASGQKEMFCIDVDLRPMREAEAALRESETRYRSLFDNFPDGALFLFDREFRYLAAGGKALAQVGLSKAHIVGKTVWEVFPDLWPDIRPYCEKAMDGQESYYEITYRGRSYANMVLPVDTSGGSSRQGIVVTQDITARKQAEQERAELQQQLIQSQKMESIGTLAGGIAHDFNNILSSIMGYTELALKDVDQQSPIGDYLQEINAAGKRARDLVRQILTFARQTEDELKPTAVDTIIQEVIKLLRPSIPSTIDIRQDIQSHSLVWSSTTKMHQILINLCTNAADAMEEEGGVLAVGLRDVVISDRVVGKLGQLSAGDYIELAVSDTGPGIPPDVIDSMFEPYVTTKAPGKGTGMGLAMVHGIVNSCKGAVTVDSTPGNGATFKVYLPITDKRSRPLSHEAEGVPPGNERILFVDDEASITKMSTQMLERLGYTVTTRTSSTEALELFRTKPDDFDLVITDMTMPQLTGDKLAVALMSIRPDIPVILCTGYSNKMGDDTARKIGIRALVYKPVLVAEFGKTVRRVLDDAANP